MTVDLDDLLAQAAAQKMQPDAALVNRVLADAGALQPVGARMVRARHLPAKTGLWSALSALSTLFGGGPALAAVGSAAVAGLFLGLAQPSSMLAFAGGLVAETPLDSVELIPSFDTLLAGE